MIIETSKPNTHNLCQMLQSVRNSDMGQREKEREAGGIHTERTFKHMERSGTL